MPFQRGHDPNRCMGRTPGSKNVLTLKRAMAEVLPESEIEDAFQGTPTDFLRSIYRDPRFPMDWRMACANSLMRAGTEQGAATPSLTKEQREARIQELLRERDGPVPLLAGPPEPAYEG